MMKDLKYSLKMIRYGAQVKLNVSSMIIFGILAIIIEVVSHGTQFLGAFYIAMITMYPMQLLILRIYLLWCIQVRWRKSYRPRFLRS